MLDKLAAIEEKYIELGEKVNGYGSNKRQSIVSKLMKEHSDIEPIVFKYREFEKLETMLRRSKRKCLEIN